MVVSKLNTSKRFGPRYGTKPKRKVDEIERSYRIKRYTCSQCANVAVKRKAAGIWECRKCGHKFASHAYKVT
ncbi:MAG: 50S ribosomal protein L37ae [Candidatus Altiarchaeota archaeon]|nr:50S ribosomal protein L37ae [Candidatus Altiarchaeota archaeon]